MDGIGDLLKGKGFDKKKRPAPHEKSATVDEIIKVVGLHPKYNYKYWLRMIGNRGFGEVMGMLKDIQGAPSKFPKGALLTNKLRKKKDDKKA